MCTHYRVEQLGALAAADLRPAAADALRRHIETCATCSRDWRSITVLRERAHALREVAPPPQLRARIEAAMGESGGARPRLRLRLGLAAALSAAAAAALFLFAAGRGVPAFAAVARAMDAVRTATWRETTVQPQQEGDLIEKSVVWARVSAPAVARRSSGLVTGTHGRPSTIPERISLRDQRGELSFTPGDGRWQLLPGWGAPNGGGLAETSREVIQSLFGPGGQEVLRGEWRGSRVTRDGRELILYTRDSGSPFSSAEESVWADPDTMRVDRRELTETERHEGRDVRLNWVSEGYRYDVTPPPGTFDLAPPAGAQIAEAPVDMASPALATGFHLEAADRAELRGLIEGAVRAWGRGDWASFSADWDFDGTAKLAPYISSRKPEPVVAEVMRSYWQRRLAAMGSRQCDATAGILNTIPVAQLPQPARRQASYRSIPPNAQQLLLLPTTVTVRTGAGSSTAMLGYFTVARGAAGYRIVWWEFAW